MSKSNSSSKIHVFQEVETPSSFNFSIPIPEESSSTPICREGEMAESTTPQTEVLPFSVPLSPENLVCSPTLVVSETSLKISVLIQLKNLLKNTFLRKQKQGPW
ncbi:hypothetical protein KY285_036266 [Solanum tuberosum]|nr:hypothetical protein KY285_036266 [Solanum tuberosum]